MEDLVGLIVVVSVFVVVIASVLLVGFGVWHVTGGDLNVDELHFMRVTAAIDAMAASLALAGIGVAWLLG